MILTQMLIGAAMLALTVVIHGSFMQLAVGFFSRRDFAPMARNNFGRTIIIVGIVLWLFLAIALETWSWAHLYLMIGALETLEEALYFSTVTFTTLGYGDLTLSPQWRLLGSFEAANGTLIFGWTTALIFFAVQRLYLRIDEDKKAG